MQKVVLDKYNACDYNHRILKAQALDHMVRRLLLFLINIAKEMFYG